MRKYLLESVAVRVTLEDDSTSSKLHHLGLYELVPVRKLGV